VFGRIHGNTIELDAALPELDGKRVRVVVEAVEEAASFDELMRNAKLDERPLDDEERAAIEELRQGKLELVPHDEVRAKLAAQKRG
jgi:hypothetical protein